MKALTLIGIFCLSTAVNCAEKARYDNYRVYEVVPQDDVHLDLLREIYEYSDGYRFLNNLPNTIGLSAQIVVPPHKFGEWSELQDKYKFKSIMITDNYQEIIDKEQLHFKRRKSFDWTSFWTLDEINEWMESLVRPNDVSLFTIGNSYEGRPINGLQINIGNLRGKPAVFFESQIHANEWIGGAVTTFIINELLTSSESNVIYLRDYFTWYFIPIFNVDGYAYTWNSDRTWRKTRGPTKNILCRGTDPNRNWDVNFGQYGASSNPCTSGYHGDFVFSEPETRQLSEFARTIPNLYVYFSFHSSGNLLMTPYAFSNTTMANHAELLEIGEIGVDSLRAVHNTSYRLGTIRNFFGYVAGSSVDWMALRLFPTLVYCYELTLTQLNPPSDIIKTGEEIFVSTMSMLQEGITRGLFP